MKCYFLQQELTAVWNKTCLKKNISVQWHYMPGADLVAEHHWEACITKDQLNPFQKMSVVSFIKIQLLKPVHTCLLESQWIQEAPLELWEVWGCEGPDVLISISRETSKQAKSLFHLSNILRQEQGSSRSLHNGHNPFDYASCGWWEWESNWGKPQVLLAFKFWPSSTMKGKTLLELVHWK